VFALELWAVVRFVLPAVLRKTHSSSISLLFANQKKSIAKDAVFHTSMSFLSAGGSHFVSCASGRLPFVILTCRQRRML
jgi:hypothetical protein